MMKATIFFTLVILAQVFGQQKEDIKVIINEKTISGPGSFTLYEGNDASQNQVCTLSWSTDYTWNFKDYDGCQNDEARSMVLYFASPGTTILIYDSPDGDKSDDYSQIKVYKQVNEPIEIDTFERDLVTDEIEMTYYRSNGLDGKVSRIEVTLF